MSTPATTPLAQTLTRQESPLATQPWTEDPAPPLDTDPSFPGEFEPLDPTPGLNDSGRQGSQAMSQGQRSLNGTLHQHQMLNHLDIVPGYNPAGSPAEHQSTRPADAADDSEDSIRLLAYQIYLRSNGQEGHALDHWLEAERQLANQHGLPPEVD